MPMTNQDVLPLRLLALTHAALAAEVRSLSDAMADPFFANAYLVRSEWHSEVAKAYSLLATQLLKERTGP